MHDFVMLNEKKNILLNEFFDEHATREYEQKSYPSSSLI
jgi:hypothetical protein